MVANSDNLVELAEKIIQINTKMRFVAFIDSDGNIVEGIMKTGKTSLQSQKDEENFCRQVAQRRAMRSEFDVKLGQVKYVHVEREFVTQLVIYVSKFTIFATVEPDLDIQTKLQIVESIKKFLIMFNDILIIFF